MLRAAKINCQCPDLNRFPYMSALKGSCNFTGFQFRTSAESQEAHYDEC